MSKRSYRGRHRAPSTSSDAAKRAGVAALLATIPAVTGATPGVANAEPPGGWEPIVQCESAGRNVENASGASTASGYYQFTNGTWQAFGGAEFAPRAIQATRAEQTIVANRAYAANGTRDWNASRSCWAGKTAPVRASAPAPAPVREPASASSGTYVVRAGDALSMIATRNGTTWRELYAKNRDVIENPNKIFPGERIRV